MRDAVNRPSRKPLAWGGLSGYLQTQAIAEALRGIPEEPETSYLRCLAKRAERVVQRNRYLAEDLEMAHSWVQRLAECLHYPPQKEEAGRVAQEVSSGQVRNDMDVLLRRFEGERQRRSAQDALAGSWPRLWRTWGPELLHCYDIPGLPQDNLKLESLFGRLRKHQRRISGQRSTQPLRDFGQHQVLFDATRPKEVLDQLQEVPVAAYRASRQRLAEAEKPGQHLHRLHRNPAAAIQRLLDEHAALRRPVASLARGHPPGLHTV